MVPLVSIRYVVHMVFDMYPVRDRELLVHASDRRDGVFTPEGTAEMDRFGQWWRVRRCGACRLCYAVLLSSRPRLGGFLAAAVLPLVRSQVVLRGRQEQGTGGNPSSTPACGMVFTSPQGLKVSGPLPWQG